MKKKCEIVICGDICPTPDTKDLFETGNTEGLFKGVNRVFKTADILVGNLEFPLTDIGMGIVKTGPVLKGKTSYIEIFKKAGFHVLGLANNHIRDCGDEGVFSTLETCKDAGINTVGAGKNSFDAKQPLIVNAGDWKIGIMAFAENEFNAADGTQAGANLLDVYYGFDQIKEFRNKVDYLIVLYHGGIEHYEYPSPMLQKKCRKMVECGADLVTCQHSHCIGTEENFGGGKIIYGQGNTVFGYRSEALEWNNGLVVKLNLSANKELNASVEYIPICADRAGIDLVPISKSQLLLKSFFSRSERLSDNNAIEESWDEYCNNKKSAHYLPLLLGLGRIVNFLNRKMGNRIVSFLYSTKRMRITQNLIRCESHNEVVNTILRKVNKK